MGVIHPSRLANTRIPLTRCEAIAEVHMPVTPINPPPKSHHSHEVSRRTHGILDYVGGALLLLAAIFFPFPDPAMRMLSASLGTILLLYSAATDYEMGLL